MVATPSPVVDPEDRRGREAGTLPPAQARNKVSLLTGMLKRRAKLAAGQPPRASARAMDNLIEPSSTPRPRLENAAVTAFRDALPTQNCFAAEGPCVEHQYDVSSRDRHGRQATRMSIVDAARSYASRRARAVRTRRGNCFGWSIGR